MPHTSRDEAPNASIQAEFSRSTAHEALNTGDVSDWVTVFDLDQIRRDASRVVAELREWAKRDRDGWGVARSRSGRAFSSPWQGERGRASALRGSQRAAALLRGVAK